MLRQQCVGGPLLPFAERASRMRSRDWPITSGRPSNQSAARYDYNRDNWSTWIAISLNKGASLATTYHYNSNQGDYIINPNTAKQCTRPSSLVNPSITK